MTELDILGTTNECPKCGNESLTTMFIAKGTWYCPTLQGHGMRTAKEEMMQTVCTYCKYRWFEKPLDAEDDRPMWEQCGESPEASAITKVELHTHHIIIANENNHDYLDTKNGKYYRCKRCGVFVDVLGDELKEDK